jgi:hypothetical protein
MPRVSAFYGIVIRMYYNEDRHTGRPHFHVVIADHEASFDIETLKPLSGSLPSRPTRWLGPQPIDVSCDSTGNLPVGVSRWCRSKVYADDMRGTPLLLEAKPTSGYGVWVRFGDGIAAEVDLSYLPGLGGVFEPMQDVEFFRQVEADREAGTIVWPNEVDIAPETLHALASEAASART